MPRMGKHTWDWCGVWKMFSRKASKANIGNTGLPLESWLKAKNLFAFATRFESLGGSSSPLMLFAKNSWSVSKNNITLTLYRTERGGPPAKPGSERQRGGFMLCYFCNTRMLKPLEQRTLKCFPLYIQLILICVQLNIFHTPHHPKCAYPFLALQHTWDWCGCADF